MILFNSHTKFMNLSLANVFSRFRQKFPISTTLKSRDKIHWVLFPKFSHTAICHALDELSEQEMVGRFTYMNNSLDFRGEIKKDGFDFLHLMEERGLRADSDTFLWLLEGCLNSGSLKDAKRVHGRILKMGFEEDLALSNQLIDIYSVYGDFFDALQMFDNMSTRNLASWNSIIAGCVAKKLNFQAVSFFLRMQAAGVEPDCFSFASSLRACGSGGDSSLHCVEQIHAKIIQSGLNFDLIVGNPLVDLYSKVGSVNSAHLVFEELYSRDSTSWVAMISGFTQNGYGEKALLLFSQMLSSGITPTPYVFSSVLSACTKLEFFEHGKQLHAQVYKMGFQSKVFIGNALISLYLRSAHVSLADRVFKDMDSRDRITYNSLISGHSQCGNGDDALKFFKQLQNSGLKPDSVTIASLLSACSTMGALQEGRELHSYVIKTGYISDNIIEGSLLDLYVKCGDVETAHELFDTTDKEDIILWNVMLVAYGQMGNLWESFKLFSQMQIAGLKPNMYTYPSVLRTCTLLGVLDLGKQIHTQITKTGFESNVYVCSVLIDMYAKCGELEIAREILGRLTEEDVVSWTAMIAGYAQHDCFVEGLKLFEEMQIRGIIPDNIGLSSALSSCAGIQALKQGLQIHGQSVVLGYSTDLSIGNSLVTFYARCGRIKDAYSAFEAIGDKDEISWNGLISGFAQSGHCEEALQMFAQMDRAGVKANLFTFCPTISASANLADLKQGRQIHTKMIKTGYATETEARNVLITLYSKCGSIKDAKREFLEMSERTEVSWNAMITGYSHHGYGREALQLFEQMKKMNLQPNHVTFLGVLSACSHVGLVSEGLGYFRSMSHEYGIKPRPEHYACVVDLLGRSGLLDDARNFIVEMPIDPDAMVWRTLLSACTVHKNSVIGEFAAKNLVSLDPEDSATYVLLSNIYAMAGKWDSRDQVRQIMKERGVKKEPGRSWIEVQNSVHAFFVGDRLHPLADKIYDFLEDLNERIVEIGYIKDRHSLLHDIDQEQKDPMVYIHSEKLAVAFGLISLSPEIPIRVMKNLRVCNDCHNWMKFISKAVRREIIVRDANRFHHFENGACSCRDYW